MSQHLESLRARARSALWWSRLLVLALGALLVVLLPLRLMGLHDAAEVGIRAFAVALVPILVVSTYQVLVRFRCPRCGTPLWLGESWLETSYGWKAQAESVRCKGCGLGDGRVDVVDAVESDEGGA